MYMSKENQTQNPSVKENTWVFIPILKSQVAKRTKDYALIKLSRGISVIISAKFIRAKETEDTIFVSLPPDYTIDWQRTRYNPQSKKYEVEQVGVYFPDLLLNEVKIVRQCLKEGKELKEIFDYDFSDLPF